MSRLRLVLTVCAAACLAGSPALAQRAEPAAAARPGAAALTASQRAAAIASVIAAVESRYVFPDRVAAIRDRLNGALAAGSYDTTEPGVFAERVSADLRESSADGHMYLTNDPAEYAAAITSDVATEENPEVLALWAEAARRSNHGLTDTRILPGNVRYLRIDAFHWVRDRTGQAYDDAMRFLREGDAVIIDLRGNGGGDHAAVRYLLSHFMEPDKLDITFFEAGKDPIQSRTLDHLPAGRIGGKPLYVLINGRVASAGEAFAYDVQQFRLGTLVGQSTVGAAHNNTMVPIAPGFMLSVSYGRPVHPVSGDNWEGKGVAPDVAVDPAVALEAAHALALEGLMARAHADPADRAGWAWAHAAVEARVRPVTLPPERLQALAGTYGGRVVLFDQGMLMWRRLDGELARLTPLTADGLFTVEGFDDRLRLRLTGDALEIHRLGEPAPAHFARD